MLGRQASRATCRQGHCLSAMQPGKGLRHVPGIPITGDSLPLVLGGLGRPLVVLQAARFRRARRPSACNFPAQTATAPWICSFLTAWRAARSRRPSRRHPQRLASRVLRIQRAPTARRRSTRALAVRLSAVGVAVTFGRGRTPCPSPPEGQPHQPLVDSTSLRTLLDCVVVG